MSFADVDFTFVLRPILISFLLSSNDCVETTLSIYTP